jgi:4-amino-4-deoxy-L-arabinose transferase-like glycosyltransferase
MSRYWRIVTPATALCLLNALKPLTVDDPAYYAFANQIAQHPCDPFGFTIFWYQHPQPAIEVLAPPVLPYWWALGIRLFGDSPLAWKLWLWPWCLLLTAALDALLRRFAPSLSAPLLWMITLSPSVLPALNIMLDVPALALSLAAVALFLRASDRESWRLTLGAGILAGLATQTKYTALTVPPVILLLLVTRVRPRAIAYACVAGITAATIFAGWETIVSWRYGTSQFLHHVGQDRLMRSARLNLAWPLVNLLGGVAAPLALLGLSTLKSGGRWVTGAAAAYVFGTAMLAWGSPDGSAMPPGVVFGPAGIMTLVLLSMAAWRGLWCSDASRDRRFLALWWLVEVLAYFVLTPWPAARRVLGIVVVGTLLLGSAAERACDMRKRRYLVWAVALSGVTMGLLIQAIDIDHAAVERDAVAAVTAQIRASDSEATIWFLGHLGLQFYGERVGWQPVLPDESRLTVGSWLVVPERDYGQLAVTIPFEAIWQAQVSIPSRWPLSTMPWYHGTSKPFNRARESMVTLSVFQISADCVMRSIEGERDHRPRTSR